MKTRIILLVLALVATITSQDPNCMMPGPQGTCLACNTYYYIKDGRCLPVNANCLGYNPLDGKCTSCMIGFQMNDRGECLGGQGATAGMAGGSFGGSSMGGLAGLAGAGGNTVVTRTTTTSSNFSTGSGGLGGLNNMFQSGGSGAANLANSGLTSGNFGVLGVIPLGTVSTQSADGFFSGGQSFFSGQGGQGAQGGQSWQTTTTGNAGGMTSGAGNFGGMSLFGGSSTGSSAGSSTTTNQNSNSGVTTTTTRTITTGTAPSSVQTFSSQGIPEMFSSGTFFANGQTQSANTGGFSSGGTTVIPVSVTSSSGTVYIELLNQQPFSVDIVNLILQSIMKFNMDNPNLPNIQLLTADNRVLTFPVNAPVSGRIFFSTVNGQALPAAALAIIQQIINTINIQYSVSIQFVANSVNSGTVQQVTTTTRQQLTQSQVYVFTASGFISVRHLNALQREIDRYNQQNPQQSAVVMVFGNGQRLPTTFTESVRGPIYFSFINGTAPSSSVLESLQLIINSINTSMTSSTTTGGGATTVTTTTTTTEVDRLAAEEAARRAALLEAQRAQEQRAEEQRRAEAQLAESRRQAELRAA